MLEVFSVATNERHILAVAPSQSVAAKLVRLLGDASRLVVVTTFAAAKVHLDSPPDLLITEVKLGEYNGLHLALRARAAGIPAIVLGDRVFEREAEQLGATYLSPVRLDTAELPSIVAHLLDDARPTGHTSFSCYESVEGRSALAESDGSEPVLHAGAAKGPLVLH